ncbi:MAG TPA: YceI family protein [Xanthomonadales bacterium]|nr:YceI family protein [Xanthomonadales bacterium]
MKARWPPLVLVTALLSCSQPGQYPRPTTQVLPDFPRAKYDQKPMDEVYCVDSENSQAEILVRRGGKLARFGHDHVIAAREMQGMLLRPDGEPQNSRADVRLDLTTLIVDEPELRQKYGLDTQPTPTDISKTAGNLQSKVLETDVWKQVHLHIKGKSESPAGLQASLTISLHGASSSFPVIIHLETPNEGRLLAQGEFKLLQSDFDIEPFSILGGALRVEGEVQVIYHLEAWQVKPDQRCSIGT